MNPGWRLNYLRYKSYFQNMIGRYREKSDVRAYVEILLSLATVSVFAIFALRPTLLTIATLMKEIESKRETLEQMQAKIDKLNSAQTLYDRERSRIDILFTSIPTNPNPEVFARQIEGFSEKHGLSIAEINIGEAVILGKDTKSTSSTEKGLSPLPGESLGLNVSATYTTDLDRYFSLSNFVSDFEKSRRPAKIDTIRIKTTTDTKERIKVLEFDIEARLPYFRD
jgi:hypothetical protein